MTTPVRIGGTTPQLIQSSPSGAPAQVAFSTLLQPMQSGAAVGTGITGRQVVAAALNGAPSPRSLSQMVARVTGGPVGTIAAGGPVGGGVAGAGNAGQQQSDYLHMLDMTRQFILTNAIFDAGNMPLVESELETGP